MSNNYSYSKPKPRVDTLPIDYLPGRDSAITTTTTQVYPILEAIKKYSINKETISQLPTTKVVGFLAHGLK